MNDFESIFAALRSLYARHEPSCVLLVDTPIEYSLGTHEVRAKDNYRTWFGAVQIKNSYVSAHVYPVYTDPELLGDVSDALKQRMQGKSCFNFKKPDVDLFEELGRLIDRGAARYHAQGRI
mgnify:CR=1 FL=1